MLNIRQAKEVDLDSLLSLNNKLFKYEVSWHDTLRGEWTYEDGGKEYFLNRIKLIFGVIFVVEYKDKLIGYLSAGNPYSLPFRTEKYHVELENMYVIEDYRRLGVGNLLFKEFEKWCLTKKVECIGVEAVYENELALNFYIKNGFKKHNIRLEKKLIEKV